MQVQQEFPRSSSRRRRDTNAGLREWLRLLDAVLAVIEEVAWSAREAGEQVLERARRQPVAMQRLAATGWCLTKIAASYRLHVTRSAFVSRARAARQLEALHEANAKRFHDLSAAHGGAFLKVGQLLSARADLLPDAWIRELSKLQDRAPTVDFEDVRRTVEQDAGEPLEARFASFDPEPLAAASIGQVHRATDHDGRALAVKVRRPGIERLVAHDLDLLEAFVLGARESLPPTDWDTVIDEVRAMVEAELDYDRERATMGRLAAFFEPLEGIRAPRPGDALSTERVLVSTFEPGARITEALDARAADGEDDRVALVLGRLLEAYVAQVLEAGEFQCDPHPGNFLVTDDDEVVVLDFGAAKTLDRATRDGYLDLVQAALADDRARFTARLAELGFATRSGRPDTLDVFADAMLDDFRAAAATGTFAFPDRDTMLVELRAMLDAADADPVVRVPAHFVMIGRVFSTLGGLFMTYRPAIDYGRHVLPTFTRAL